MPEDTWVDPRDFKGEGTREEPFRDPHGFLERFAATEVGAFLEGRPIGVGCEGMETVP